MTRIKKYLISALHHRGNVARWQDNRSHSNVEIFPDNSVPTLLSCSAALSSRRNVCLSANQYSGVKSAQDHLDHFLVLHQVPQVILVQTVCQVILVNLLVSKDSQQ